MYVCVNECMNEQFVWISGCKCICAIYVCIFYDPDGGVCMSYIFYSSLDRSRHLVGLLFLASALGWARTNTLLLGHAVLYGSMLLAVVSFKEQFTQVQTQTRLITRKIIIGE